MQQGPGPPFQPRVRPCVPRVLRAEPRGPGSLSLGEIGQRMGLGTIQSRLWASDSSRPPFLPALGGGAGGGMEMGRVLGAGVATPSQTRRSAWPPWLGLHLKRALLPPDPSPSGRLSCLPGSEPRHAGHGSSPASHQARHSRFPSSLPFLVEPSLRSRTAARPSLQEDIRHSVCLL